MHDAETRALRRALALLLLLSLARWAWVERASPAPPPETILPGLSAAVTEATLSAERRGRPLGEGELIDPNRAPEEELDRLPGVGPSRAAAIVRARDGGALFRTPGDLTAVRGIGPVLAEKMAPHLDLATPAPRARASAPSAAAPVVDLNRAGPEELRTLPGVGPALADRIVRHRRERPFQVVDDVLRVRGIGPATLERIRSRVRVGGAR